MDQQQQRQTDQLSSSNLQAKGPAALPSSLLQAISGPLDCSPVTDLARNLGGLLSNSRGTPRRRISWSSNEDTPDGLPGLRKPLLFLGGSTDNSPVVNNQQDSPMFKDRLLRDVSVADNCLNTSGNRGIRRVRTLPLTLQDPFGKENVPRSRLENIEDVASSPSDFFLSRPCCPQTSSSASVSTNNKTGRAMFSPQSDSDSHDSGYGLLLQEHAAPEKSFMAPTLPPPKRLISPLKSISNQQALSRLNSAGSSFGCSSSERSSQSASCDDADDGFLDVFDMDTLDFESTSLTYDFPLPRDFHHLIKGPLSSSTSEDTPHTRSSQQASPKRPPIRRCLSMIEESPVARPLPSPREKLLSSIDRNNNFGNLVRRPEDTRKRLLQDEEETTFKKPCEPSPTAGELRTQQDWSAKHNHETKRRKSVSYLTKSCSDSLVLPSPRVLLHRSHSETDAIMSALNKSTHNPNLIGDCSGTYALPMIKGRHDDLKTITCSTLSDLIQGAYKDEVTEYSIVDCRYPYEFEGGHIKGACNLYTKESILEKLINQQPPQSPSSKCHRILVFHCEFSSERGPSLCRFLRNKDREANKDNYPNLFHPEVYLLEGGYRDFFTQYKVLCTPQNYLPMLSKDHEKDLKKFRSKSKSWSGDTKSRIAVRPGLKL